MKLIIFIVFYIIHLGYSAPITCTGCEKEKHCLKLTPETENEIDVIVSKLTDYLNDLAVEHEDFDVTLIKIEIERHSDEEEEEKDVKLQILVNDCAKIDTDHSGASNKTAEDSNDEKNTNDKSDENEVVSKSDDDAKNHDGDDAQQTDITEDENKSKNDHDFGDDDENHDDEQNAVDKKQDDDPIEDEKDSEEKAKLDGNADDDDDLELYCEEYEEDFESKEKEATENNTTKEDTDSKNDDDKTEESTEPVVAAKNPLADLILQSNNSQNDINNIDSSKDTDSEQGDEEATNSEEASTDVAVYSPKNEVSNEIVQPEIMVMNLPEDVEDLLRKLEKKRGRKQPLLVYVQKTEDENRYAFLNK